MSRLQPHVATNREIQLRPGVGEGRNNVLERGRHASPMSESVQARVGFSLKIEEQNRTDREYRRVSPCPFLLSRCRENGVLDVACILHEGHDLAHHLLVDSRT